MHIVTQPIRVRSRRKVYLPHERIQVNGVGLGEVDGLFNIGKMFSRMFHFTPRSFQPKNIFGAIGSVVLTGGTLGLAPKISGAHSKAAKITGMAVAAATAAYVGGSALFSSTGRAGVAVAGSTGAATTGGGLVSTIGSGLSTIGSGLMKVLPFLSNVFSGGVGGRQQQSAPYEQPYGPQQPQQYFDPLAVYNANVARSAGAPLGGGSESYQSTPPNVDYSQPPIESQLLSPDKDGLQYPQAGIIDPATGQVIPQRVQEMSMIPDLSGTTWLILGGVTVVGWYLLLDSKKEIGNA